MNKDFPQLIQGILDGLRLWPEVEGVLLGGARAQMVLAFDNGSDFNIYVYVYVSEIPDIKKRTKLLQPLCTRLETDNQFIENKDTGKLNDGTDFELIYRSLENFHQHLTTIIDGGVASTGYSTCVWTSLLNTRVFFDRSGKIQALVGQFSVPYPDHLVKAIVDKNWPLLVTGIASNLSQIQKASKRMDWISVRHRLNAFLASYFDILFAINRVLHPGEKRLIEQATASCSMLPVGFTADLETLNLASSPWIIPTLERLAQALETLLVETGWLERHSVLLAEQPLPSVNIFTDGGCIGNPGKGAWAFIIKLGNQILEGTGGEVLTTNNQMELLAVIRALETVQSRFSKNFSEVQVFTDSQYVKNGITVWIKGWEANGWKTASKEPVKNQELWKTLRILDQQVQPRWSWIKGHAGHPENEHCDQLVRKTMENL